MDLSMTYLGLKLDSPLVPGASPLTGSFDTVRRLEDAGAAAIVLPSLFEEQLAQRAGGVGHTMDEYDDAYLVDVASYFPKDGGYRLDPDRYVEHLRRVKGSVKVPVIASLNGTLPDGWTRYATALEQAGADAIEVNVYAVVTDPFADGGQVEGRTVETAAMVKRAVSVPVAVKLSPFFSSIPNLVRKLDDVGVDGLVLFNRFYQPDIDLEQLEAVPAVHLSDPSELLLRLQWLAVLAGRVDASLAVTGGVHSAGDALKAVAVGADAVQMVSALILYGPDHLKKVRDDMERWMEDHEFASLRHLHGSASLRNCPDPFAFERGGYLRALQEWRPPAAKT